MPFGTRGRSPGHWSTSSGVTTAPGPASARAAGSAASEGSQGPESFAVVDAMPLRHRGPHAGADQRANARPDAGAREAVERQVTPSGSGVAHGAQDRQQRSGEQPGSEANDHRSVGRPARRAAAARVDAVDVLPGQLVDPLRAPERGLATQSLEARGPERRSVAVKAPEIRSEERRV